MDGGFAYINCALGGATDLDPDRPKNPYFTPGPVQMSPEIASYGGLQVPYFRNERFSTLTLECEQHLLSLAKAPEGSRVVFLSASGTGGLDAAVSNFASVDEPSIILNGGGFGQRIVDIAQAYRLSADEHKQPMRQGFTSSDDKIDSERRYTAVFANLHETSSGARNDVSAFHKAYSTEDHRPLFIVDAISAFLCDPIDMAAQGIDVLVTASQKALALAPGLAIMILSPRAIERVVSRHADPKNYYFDLAPYLRDGERGQTPFTPALAVMMQLFPALERLQEMGIDAAVADKTSLANHFRETIRTRGLPFEVFAKPASNAITALTSTEVDADELVRHFDERHRVYLTPNGGELKHSVFRVSHMGDQTVEDLDRLCELLAKYVAAAE